MVSDQQKPKTYGYKGYKKKLSEQNIQEHLYASKVLLDTDIDVLQTSGILMSNALIDHYCPVIQELSHQGQSYFKKSLFVRDELLIVGQFFRIIQSDGVYMTYSYMTPYDKISQEEKDLIHESIKKQSSP
jgi:hypothetical protein